MPLLHHGLLVDPYQLYETRVIGGDGVVLLAAAFEDEDERLAAMHGIALELGLDVVVEVASEREIDAVMDLVDPDSFLIRNRDGENGAAEFERTFSLLEEVPAGKAVLSQGGIRSREHAAALESVGVDAAVIGRWICDGELARTLDVLRGDRRVDPARGLTPTSSRSPRSNGLCRCWAEPENSRSGAAAPATDGQPKACVWR